MENSVSQEHHHPSDNEYVLLLFLKDITNIWNTEAYKYPFRFNLPAYISISEDLHLTATGLMGFACNSLLKVLKLTI